MRNTSRSYFFDIPGIGIACIKKYKNSRSIRTRLEPDGNFLVTIPMTLSYKEAIKTIKEQKQLFLDLKTKVKEIGEKHECYYPNMEYETKFHKLSLVYHNDKHFALKTDGTGDCKIFIPQNSDIKSTKNQAIIRQLIREIYRYEAKKHIIPRTIHFAEKHCFKIRKITIKNAKRRWGSCSTHGNLNFNLNLMRLPDELIDYVILHELAHLKVSNHSTNFWNFLCKILPKAKELNIQLKKHSLKHYAT